MSNKTSRFALGAIIVAAAGYVAGVLTAPKSGKETREEIKETALSTVAETEKRLKQAHTELSKNIDEMTAHANSIAGAAKKEAETLLEAAHSAKEKVRLSLSSIHDGEVSDKDLKAAIVEADKAVTHLKKFLKK